MLMKTPLQPLPNLSHYLGIDLRVKRDDLFGITGGGNKARKTGQIMLEAERQGANALVTTGGLQSNHARVAALAAAVRGWRCRLILHGDPAEAVEPRGNLLLMRLVGAEIEIVDPTGIATAMQNAMENLRQQGVLPYEVPGGGHCIAGAMAYVQAVDEIDEQCRGDGWRPDWIIIASGTGTTQAGIVVGLERLRWHSHVVGVSVARRNPRGRHIVEDASRELRSYLALDTKAHKIDFRDDWVGGGYEEAGPQVLSAIRMAARKDALILDPTYTGKAFAGLLDLVADREIEPGSRVLFWHTGGLLNLMASSNRWRGIWDS